MNITQFGDEALRLANLMKYSEVPKEMVSPFRITPGT
jgi:hypothetical protein